jgi:hypothetical protein
MLEEKDIRKLLEKYESQRAELGETVTIDANSMVAMMQLELESKIKLLKYILK